MKASLTISPKVEGKPLFKIHIFLTRPFCDLHASLSSPPEYAIPNLPLPVDRMSTILSRQNINDPNNDPNDFVETDVPFWWTRVRSLQDLECRIAHSSAEWTNCSMVDIPRHSCSCLCLLNHWILPCEEADQEGACSTSISPSKSDPHDAYSYRD